MQGTASIMEGIDFIYVVPLCVPLCESSGTIEGQLSRFFEPLFTAVTPEQPYPLQVVPARISLEAMVIAPNACYVGELDIGIDADVVYRFHWQMSRAQRTRGNAKPKDSVGLAPFRVGNACDADCCRRNRVVAATNAGRLRRLPAVPARRC